MSTSPFYNQPWFIPVLLLVSTIILLHLSSQPMANSSNTESAIDRTQLNRYVDRAFNAKITEMITNLKNNSAKPGSYLPVKRLADSQKLRILVTGGAGFVGSHLVDKLMMAGHYVYVLDNFFTGRKTNIEHWIGHPNFELLMHDVVETIYVEVDRIYHLACPASPPHYQYNPIKTIKTSTEGTLHMLGLAKRVKARMLLTSTSEVYGDPEVHPQKETYWGNVNPIGPRACYDEGKRVAETMMYAYQSQSHVDVRVARIFNTFGPRMHPNDGRVVSNFIIQALQGKDITIYGDGSQTRSFQYVDDLVDGLIKLMEGDYSLPVNLGNPDEYTVGDFAKMIKEITHSQSEIKFLPSTKDDPKKRKPDITVAKEQLGWQPQWNVREGLAKAVDYFKKELDDAGGEIIPTGPLASKPQQVISTSSSSISGDTSSMSNVGTTMAQSSSSSNVPAAVSADSSTDALVAAVQAASKTTNPPVLGRRNLETGEKRNIRG